MRNLSLADLAFRQSIASDTDALNYLSAVETADGQALEDSVRNAINLFVVGCKLDDIWSSMSACGLTCAARTSAGALIPIKGPSPTLSGMTAANYARNGFIQSANNQYINTNRNLSGVGSSSNNHFCAWLSSVQVAGNYTSIAGFDGSAEYFMDATRVINANNTASPLPFVLSGFIGTARKNSTQYEYFRRGSFVVTSGSLNVSAPSTSFRLGQTVSNNDGRNRYGFYSVGPYLNLSFLAARLQALMAALAASTSLSFGA